MRTPGVANWLSLAGLVATLLVWPGAAELKAGLSISPAYVEVKLDKGRPAGEFVVGNVGDIEERYRIKSIHFTFTPDGGLVKKDADEFSLAPWIVFSPRELTMPPKTKRVVRFVITPRGQLAAGEYWAGMELESLNTTSSEGKNDKGVGMKIEVVSKILVPIFGQFGQVSYSAELKDCRLLQSKNPATIETVLMNTGTGRLFMNGKYELSDSNGKIVETGPMARMYVMRQTERDYKSVIKAAMPAGHYRYSVEFTSPQLKEPLTRSCEFDWKPAETTEAAVAAPPAKPAEPH